MATAHAIQTIAPRLTQDYVEEVMQSVRRGARGEVRVTINTALARQTLGVDPSVLKGDDAKTAPKAK